MVNNIDGISNVELSFIPGATYSVVVYNFVCAAVLYLLVLGLQVLLLYSYVR